MSRMFAIAIFVTMFGLSGCASNGASNQQRLQAGEPGSTSAQASAQTIAPITSYISNVR